MMISVKRRSRETSCPYCRDELDMKTSMSSCSSCQTSYHAECWRELAGCAILGCAARVATDRRAVPRESGARLGFFDAVAGPVATLLLAAGTGFIIAFQPDNIVMGLIGAAIGLILGMMAWMIHCVINGNAR